MKVFRFPLEMVLCRCNTHLSLRGASFIPDEQQVTLTIDHDLLFEAAACGRQQTTSETHT